MGSLPLKTISGYTSSKDFRLLQKVIGRVKDLSFQTYVQNQRQKEGFSNTNKAQITRAEIELLWLKELVQKIKESGAKKRTEKSLGGTLLVIYPLIEELADEFRQYPATNKEHVIAIFGEYIARGKGQQKPVMKRMLHNMHEKGTAIRRQEHVTRSILEMQQRNHEGWFIVFNTLTVNAQDYEKVFENGSTCWIKYKQRLEYAIRGRKKQKGDELVLTTFATTQRGKKTRRLHIHAIHCMKNLPAGNKDPNTGALAPNKILLTCMIPFWPYGISYPVMVRLGAGDAFGQLNWRWPAEYVKDRWQPIPAKPPESLARYLTRDMTKKQESSSVMPWRTKTTRHLGTAFTSRLLAGMSNNQLTAVMNLPSSKEIKLMYLTLPINLLRNAAQKEWTDRKMNDGRTRAATWKQLCKLAPVPPITQRLGVECQNAAALKTQRWLDSDMHDNQDIVDLIKSRLPDIERNLLGWSPGCDRWIFAGNINRP